MQNLDDDNDNSNISGFGLPKPPNIPSLHPGLLIILFVNCIYWLFGDGNSQNINKTHTG